MLGTKLYKPLTADFLVDLEGNKVANTDPNTLSKYTRCAEWCSNNNAHIEEHEGYYEVVKNVTYEYTLEELTEKVRSVRDFKLSTTDKYFLPDYPGVTPEVLEEIKVYRQALRDIPQQPGFPKNVIWPVEPAFLTKKSNS